MLKIDIFIKWEAMIDNISVVIKAYQQSLFIYIVRKSFDA